MMGLCAHTAMAHGRALGVDVDPLRIAYRITQELHDPGYDIVHESDPRALSGIRKLRDYDMIFVDAPGSLEGRDVLRELLRRVSYVIIPSDHEPTTRVATLDTVDLIAPTGVPYRVLLNNLDPSRGVGHVKKAREWLDKKELPYFRTLVRRYVAWPTSLDEGRTITQWRGKNSANARQDISAVHTELLLDLAKRRVS